MPTPLMISVAGVRGIVGDSLTPTVVTRFVHAFAGVLPPGPVVVGRDARTSGPLVYHAVAAGLIASGRDVINLGLATTPTTQVAVEHHKAAGGIIITASHNPAPWNALKFLSNAGEFLGPQEGAKVRARFEANDDAWQSYKTLGQEREDGGALDVHLRQVVGLPYVAAAAIRRRNLSVAVDGCASIGGIAVPALLQQLGARVTELDCEPNGQFTRELEPLPEHLTALGRMTRDAKADFGVAVDPDSDRAAFVDANGAPLGEEYTLALGASVVLGSKQGPVVTNLSTSRMIDAVAARHGVSVFRSPVGEAHVVAEMKKRSAVAGGEGNGGMILPDAHYGRDALIAVALVCQAMTSSGKTLRQLADELPHYSMLKEKVDLTGEPWQKSADRLRAAFKAHAVGTDDGLRFSKDDEWLHVRPSGTEPVVRLIAESPTEHRTRALIEEARRAVLQG